MGLPLGIIRLGLTVAGVIGVPVTSWLSVVCHEKAKEKTDKKEKLKCYIPAIISGMATGGCIIGSHKIGTKEIAGLTAAATYAVANRDKLQQKLTDILPKEEATKAIAETSSAAVPTGASIEYTGNGTMKCLEGYSGRLFYSSLEAVINAENRLNQGLQRGDYVCLNDFYRYLNITETHFGNQWGWVPNDDYYDHWYDDNPICFENTIVDDEDGNPLLVIDVYTYPMESWLEV
ncbi:DUF6353 family protein [Pseudobutyrivibrio sp.]